MMLRILRGPLYFKSSGEVNSPCGNSRGSAPRIYGAYRAAPSAMGPQKSTTYCTFRSTLPAHTGLVPAARPTMVDAKYLISSMA